MSTRELCSACDPAIEIKTQPRVKAAALSGSFWLVRKHIILKRENTFSHISFTGATDQKVSLRLS